MRNKSEPNLQLYFKNIPLHLTILAVVPIKEPPTIDINKHNICSTFINKSLL